MILRWSITVLSFFIQFSGSSPSPNHRQPASLPPDILFQETGILPKEHQVSVFFKKGEIKRFILTSEKTGVPLSIAVIPCSSEVSWSVYLAPLNRSLTSDRIEGPLLQDFRSSDLDIYKTTSSKIGQYIVEIKPLDRDTNVQMFASKEPVPPHLVRMSQSPKIRLQPRQRRRRVTIKWDQSPIDPHVTEYCLVLSNRKKYTSLCGARGDKYGPYGHGPGPVKGNTSKMSNNGDQDQGNLLISCMGSRTHHTIENLEHGKSYFLSLFAINQQNNLTFLYGSDTVLYNEKVKQSKLKVGTTENVNLKRLDGRAVFKLKAGRRTGETMAVSVMPCGGAVDVIVFKQGKPKQIMEERKKIFYGRFLVKSVRKGERFIIEVKSSNKEQLRRTSRVEILATTQKRLPLPELPTETDVREYKSLRNCDSVTIGWMPSPDPLADRYCILTRETHKSDEELRAPNQCTLDMILRKNDIPINRQCFNKEQNDRDKVITEKINRLKPNRKYIVQVIVEKVKGKPLSYDFLTVQTNSKCT